jgi:hypothetical protein
MKMRKVLAAPVLAGALFLGTTALAPSPAGAAICLDNECLHTYGPYPSWSSAATARDYLRLQFELQNRQVVSDTVYRVTAARYAVQIVVNENIG